VACDVKFYRDHPNMLVDVQTLACSFCPDHHALELHGWYHRYALFPAAEDTCLPIRRLLCTRTGKTVSLLPDFCIPRRQHGPAILGLFLAAVLITGLALLKAIQKQRPSVTYHSVAQSLLSGFTRRQSHLRAYLAQTFPRFPEAPATVQPVHRSRAEVFLALTAQSKDIPASFRHHGRLFHDCGQLGLA
jgi:hypothetical protein